jgi:hypothetical protein
MSLQARWNWREFIPQPKYTPAGEGKSNEIEVRLIDFSG